MATMLRSIPRLGPLVIGVAALPFALAGCHDTTSPSPTPGSRVVPCMPGTNPTTVSLPVGGVRVLASAAALGCVALTTPEGAGGEFVVIAANADTLPDALGQYVMADSGPSVMVASVAAERVAGMVEAGLPRAEAWRIRAMERRLYRSAGARRRLVAAVSAARAGGITRAMQLPRAGDTLSLNVPDPNADTACNHFTPVRATVVAVGRHGILLQDVTAPAGGFTASDFAAISSEFDDRIYPADTTHFGSPSDVNGDGHVYLLYTPRVNAGTPRGAAAILEGFFFGGDLFPPSACPESNLAEIFYLIVPDTGGVFGDRRSVASVRENTRGTIAHELQHMINAGVRIVRDDSPDEAVWLDEGLSHFAEELVGRAELGVGDLTPLAIRDIADQGSDLSDFTAFFGQNLLRLREWLRAPNRIGATSAHADTSLAVRGAAWALLRWSADHYAAGDVAAFTRALVAGPDTSVDNLSAVAGAPFDSIMAGWLIANEADDAGIAGLDPRYGYTSWNLRSVEAAVNRGAYPLALVPLTDGAVVTRRTSSAAGDYFQLTLTRTRAVIGEVSATGAPVSYAGARLYILRTR